MTTDENLPSHRPRRLMRRVLLAAILLAAVVTVAGAALRLFPFSPASPTPPEAKGAHLEPAVVTGIQAFRERVLKDPHSAKSWGALGEVFFANDLEEESRICFAEAERLDPTDSRWPYFQAGPLLNRGEREAALPYLLRAVERCRQESEAAAPRLRLAETLLALGRLDEAEIHIRHVGELQPEDPRAQFDAALLAVSRQDWETARADLLPCLGSPYTLQKARIQLAAVCRRLGDAADADEFQAQADRLPDDPDWNDPFITEALGNAVTKRNRYYLAERLETAGNIADEVDVLRKMTKEFPDDYLPHLTLGKVLAQTGAFQEAEQALRKALRLAPNKVQAHYYLSLLLLEEGVEWESQGGVGRARAADCFRESVELARQALAVKPDYGFAQMTLGRSLDHLGRRADALAALRQAVRCNPEYGELHFRLGETLAEDGQNAEARARLEQALRLAPPDVGWRRRAQALLAEL